MASGFNGPSLPRRYAVRARLVVPVGAPPIPSGGVLIEDGKVAAVGSWTDIATFSHQGSIDLGAVALVPGFINAHCHLDYTDMAGQIAPVKIFSDWIKAMLALKAHRGYSDYAQSWLRGARMLLAHGVSTVADIEAVPELLPEVITATPLRVCSFLEMTGVRSRRPPEQIIEEAVGRIQRSPACWMGLSPHAPYSTTPELLRQAGLAARQRSCLMAMHVAESADEFEMYQSASGAMFDWLRPQRDMGDCGNISPVAYLHSLGVLGPNFLAVHVNYVAAGDSNLLAESGTHVVHCPRSHDYFKHRPFPYAELRRRGVNICLGTDSLATTRVGRGNDLPELDLFAEMRMFSRRNPQVAPSEILEMVTVNPARALNRAGELGQLVPGAWADMLAIPYSGRRDLLETIVHHIGPLRAVMVKGTWILPPDV